MLLTLFALTGFMLACTKYKSGIMVLLIHAFRMISALELFTYLLNNHRLQIKGGRITENVLYRMKDSSKHTGDAANKFEKFIRKHADYG